MPRKGVSRKPKGRKKKCGCCQKGGDACADAKKEIDDLNYELNNTKPL